ncbi:MAG TPA: hypothetical protein VIN59_05725 [Alphaproteobacteria bacterium]
MSKTKRIPARDLSHYASSAFMGGRVCDVEELSAVTGITLDKMRRLAGGFPTNVAFDKGVALLMATAPNNRHVHS